MTRRPPGAENAYVICGFTAAMVTEMTREGGPRPDELREAVDTAISRMGTESSHPALALCRPVAAILSGDVEGALGQLDLIADHPDPWTRAARHVFLAYLTLNQADIDRAARESEAAYAGFREVGDRWGMGSSLVGMAEVALARGRPDEAVRAGEQAYAFITEGISPDQGGVLLIQTGRARAMAGDFAGARADLERGVRSAERAGEHGDAAGGWVWLSEIARREDDLDQARSLLDRAVSLLEPKKARVDLGTSLGMTFSKRGCVAEQEGDLEEAVRWHEKAFRAIERIALMPVDRLIGTLVQGVVALATAQGEHVRAAELLGGAHTAGST